METRVWGGSPLIGKRKDEIEKQFHVEVIKVSRGLDATNPPDELILQEADYITYIGKSADCIKVLRSSKASIMVRA